ncbi:CaiB/BaiF CoA transferase family protein [Ferrovibrio xuzhouensis]|uniref:CaiB/BaiF CoA transferase family protein n=1 Tax=Ferrovibrio xuzhouensis TaxID=1576914 RepID=A0ABV7VBU8_9PROT
MGPLTGYRIVEMAGIGPGPFCAMMLADMGAEVIRIDRPEAGDLGIRRDPRYSITNRGRRSLVIDLKKSAGVEVVRRLLGHADGLIEGYRPGVMERLGLGPDVCHAINPKLVYGRMTGWGQDGPLSAAAGHDLNYIALSGALYPIGPEGSPPPPPLNLVGDFGGGAMYLAFGLVCGLLEATRSGKGQMVDAAIVDGVSSLMSFVYGYMAGGYWSERRGTNILDGSVPWYASYETSDGRYIAIAAVEARFYRQLVEKLGLGEAEIGKQHDRSAWPGLKQTFADIFRTRTRQDWSDLLEGTDVCFAPVLTPQEVPLHPHIRARGNFIEVDGIIQPGPAPQFSRTPGAVQGPPPQPGQHTAAILAEWGFGDDEIRCLQDSAAIR